ncbi:MAG: Nif3-like dinuclear metal center hexameric protein [Eubacteriales bacterium]
MKPCEFAKIIDKIAPEKTACSWDNSGLIIDLGKDITGIMIALDLKEEVIDQAILKKCNMILTHHPIMFNAIKRISSEDEQGELIAKLIINGISLYSAHTTFDACSGGINDALAKKLGLNKVKVIAEQEDNYLKAVVFVPKGYEDTVFEAAVSAGAATIGDYTSCSFRSFGVGTFRPGECTDPFIGSENNQTSVEETRIEFILNPDILDDVLTFIKEAHPYECPVIDVYKLKSPVKEIGIARIGELKNDIAAKDFLKFIKEKLNLNTLRVSGDMNMKIRKVCVCGGGGDGLTKSAYIAGADAFITGELKYSTHLTAKKMGMLLIEAGHYETEIVFVNAIYSCLQESKNIVKYNVQLFEEEKRCPYIYI